MIWKTTECITNMFHFRKELGLLSVMESFDFLIVVFACFKYWDYVHVLFYN